MELGGRPYLALGHLHEKKEDYYEAIRMYNRDIKKGSTRADWDDLAVGMGDMAPVVEETVPEGIPPEMLPDRMRRTDGQSEKKRLLAKLGSDWLIKRLCSQDFKPLSDEERAKGEDCFKMLGSDSILERETAVAGLVNMGRKVVPIIRKGLESEDHEVRALVREILAPLAEPE
jgi:hypothetical protein